VSFTSRTVSVGTSPILLTQGRGDRGPQSTSDFSSALYNLGVGVVYLGASDVAVGTGFPFAEGATASFGDLGFDDKVYGISASGTVDVRVLELG
jgi:hypothetical protein